MALGSTQPLTEISTRNLPGDKEWPARKADNLTFICEQIVYKMWEPPRPVTGIVLPFYLCHEYLRAISKSSLTGLNVGL
jgi:hypothetical protein